MVKKLKSQFSFGFELEAILDKSIMSRDNMKDVFDTFLGDNGDLHYDGSIHYRGDKDVTTFEYASPVLQYTPMNIEKAIKFLDSLKNWGVIVNRSCGFHTHISFPEISKVDIFWFIMWLCGTGKYHEFDKLGRTNLYNGHYASPRFLNCIEQYIMLNRPFDAYYLIMTNDKYRSIRLHPQGTIEWRGPRTFLNVPSHTKTMNFFKKLDLFISSFVESMNCKAFESNGNVFYRSDIEKYVKEHKLRNFMFKERVQGKKDLFTTLGRSPEILEKIPYKDLVKNTETIVRALTENCSVMNYCKYQSNNLFKFILNTDMITNKYEIISRFFNVSYVLNNADKLYDNKLLSNTLRNIYGQNFMKSIIVLDKIKEWHKEGKYGNAIKMFINSLIDNYNIRYTFFTYLLENDLDCYLDNDKKTSIITTFNSDIANNMMNGYRCIDCDNKMILLRIYEVFKSKGLLDDSILKNTLPY